MKILGIMLTYNYADMIKFTLRHYSTFLDELWAFDDKSTDGTREALAACPIVKLEDWPYPGSGIDEDLFLNFAYETYPKAVGKFDWVCWIDPDEIIYAPDIRQVFDDCIGKYDVIQSCGYNMLGEGLPKDDGVSQIWELSPIGVHAPLYAKPIIFNPSVKMVWNRGKHHLLSEGLRVTPHSCVKLLHYKYLGEEYTKYRNKKNYDRCGLKNNDKSAAWTCVPEWKGEGSPEWVSLARKEQFNVIDAIPYQ